MGVSVRVVCFTVPRKSGLITSAHRRPRSLPTMLLVGPVLTLALLPAPIGKWSSLLPHAARSRPPRLDGGPEITRLGNYTVGTMRNYNAYGLEGPSLLDADGDGIITKEELDSASLLAILSETDLYKEMSRQTRRDEYDYQDWINVRSSNRLLSNLRTLPASRVVRSLWRELAFLVSVSATIRPLIQLLDLGRDHLL